MFGDAMHLLCYFIYVLFASGINVLINVPEITQNLGSALMNTSTSIEAYTGFAHRIKYTNMTDVNG
jgi:hypothetical protein